MQLSFSDGIEAGRQLAAGTTMRAAAGAQGTAELFLSAFLGGLAVGWIFFYGLHRTVQALPRARHPTLLLAVSLLLRLALLGTGTALLLFAGGDWPHLLAGFAGVMLMRLILVLRFGRGRRPVAPREPDRRSAGERGR